MVGNPQILHSDNGAEFVNNLIDDYLKNNDIKHVTGAVAEPRQQGSVERVNQTLQKALENAYNSMKEKYDLRVALASVVSDYNKTKHSKTKFKPVEALKFTVEKNTKELEEMIVRQKNANYKKAGNLVL